MCERGNRCSRLGIEYRNKCPMSPCSREHVPSSRTVLLLAEHQRPATPCSVAPGCRPDATTARRFLRWFGRLGRPIMGKQGMFNISLEARLMDTADPKILFLVCGTRKFSIPCSQEACAGPCQPVHTVISHFSKISRSLSFPSDNSTGSSYEFPISPHACNVHRELD
jgi:hypothetical protein